MGHHDRIPYTAINSNSTPKCSKKWTFDTILLQQHLYRSPKKMFWIHQFQYIKIQRAWQNWPQLEALENKPLKLYSYSLDFNISKLIYWSCNSNPPSMRIFAYFVCYLMFILCPTFFNVWLALFLTVSFPLRYVSISVRHNLRPILLLQEGR